jgi:hypothetical protein
VPFFHAQDTEKIEGVNRAAKSDRVQQPALPAAAASASANPTSSRNAKFSQAARIVPAVQISGAMVPTLAVAPAPDAPTQQRGAGEAQAAASDPVVSSDRALRGIGAALFESAAGERKNTAVKVLYMGASDRMAAELRRLLQGRYGDAGRGLMMPPGTFRTQRIAGTQIRQRGSWSHTTAAASTGLPIGLTAIAVSARDPDAIVQAVQETGQFDWVELSLLAGPGRGSVVVAIDQAEQVIDTASTSTGSIRTRLAQPGRSLTIRPQGNGEIALSSWALGTDQRGATLAYVGTPDATVAQALSAEPRVAQEELRHMAPDLIILDYGLNEAFDQTLDLATYEAQARQLVLRLRSALPKASMIVLGPRDAAMLPDFAAASGAGASAPCRPLGRDELATYPADLAAGEPRLARWHAPPNLARIRAIWRRQAASAGALFWDWAAVMGGPCASHIWVHSKPQLGGNDHRLLTERGYVRSAEALFTEISSAEARTRLASD